MTKKKKQQEEAPKPRTLGAIDVFGLKYQVIEEKETENVFWPNEDNDGQIGLCCHGKEIIYIYSDMSLRQKRATLAHELTHAFVNAISINKTFYEEHLCTLMEWMSFDIVREVDRIYPEKATRC